MRKLAIVLLLFGLAAAAQVPGLPQPGSGSGGGSSTRTWAFSFRGVVQAGVAGFTANLPAANAPAATNAGGTDPAPVLEWPAAAAADYAWWLFELPAGYVSNANISYTIESRSADSTNYVTVTPSWACVSTGAVDAPTWTAVSTFNITSAATRGRTTTTGTIAPTCAAGAQAGVKLTINTNVAGHVMTSPFDLIALTLSVQGGL